MKKKQEQIAVNKPNLHPRNLDNSGYDFEKLTLVCPELQSFVFVNKHHIQTIDFANPDAVKTLNKSLLAFHFGIQNWDIPKNYLCPPIPGRADYIHYIADLLTLSNNGIIPKGQTIQGLDIGIGANCIYPIIGNSSYDWTFVGTDIDENAIQNCRKIIQNNSHLIDVISLQLQTEPRFIFKNIITPEDRFAFTICNPPFHKSEEEANKGTLRKISNLKQQKTKKAVLNFGGQNGELWCDGGELRFITQMIYESVKYPLNCLWFTTLVSKKEHLSTIYKTLNKVNAAEIKTVDMAQGQKTSRFVAWTFMTSEQQQAWMLKLPK
jgi:23S rRNA (adenine1618-N6)-methyltransferase